MAITFQDVFSSELETFGSPLTTGDIVLSLIASLLTGLFIFYIYKKTYSGVLYSKNFNVTLVMATIVASVIIMAIGGNLALSLGMVGALSIIRFRTPIKDPKDITFLFWAIAAGVVNGIRFYKLSIISSLILAAVLIYFAKKESVIFPYVMILKYKNVTSNSIRSLLKKHTRKFEARNLTLGSDGFTEQTFELRLDEKDVEPLTKSLRELSGMQDVMLFSHTGELSE